MKEHKHTGCVQYICLQENYFGQSFCTIGYFLILIFWGTSSGRDGKAEIHSSSKSSDVMKESDVSESRVVLNSQQVAPGGIRSPSNRALRCEALLWTHPKWILKTLNMQQNSIQASISNKVEKDTFHFGKQKLGIWWYAIDKCDRICYPACEGP